MLTGTRMSHAANKSYRIITALLIIAVFSHSATLAATQDVAVDAAKREGEVVFYASMNLGEANALIGEFEKRYPSIKVKLNRAASEKLLTRVLAEARAKKNFADVIQTVEFSMHIFNRSGILARYVPPANSLYPKEFKQEGFWTTVYYNTYVTGYIFDINIPAASVERMKERGAPIDWTALGEIPAIMVGIGLAAQAGHPNAAKVFLDFVLSREGQRLMQTPGRLVARADLSNEQAAMLKGLKIVPVDPVLAEKLDEYAKQLRSIFSG
jgi:ABC-type Fe3+ transport system substrate-binding protein